MKLRKHSIRSRVAAWAVAAATLVSSISVGSGLSSRAADDDEYMKTKCIDTYTAQQVMANYGLVALNNLAINAHCHSNFLTGGLENHANSGLNANDTFKDISINEEFYFERIDGVQNNQISNSAAYGYLYIGGNLKKVEQQQVSNLTFIKDESNPSDVKEISIEKPGYARIIENKTYVNLADMQQKMIAYNKGIQGMQPVGDVRQSFVLNNSQLIVEGTGNHVVKVSAADLAADKTTIRFKDIDESDTSTSVVINVDMNGMSGDFKELVIAYGNENGLANKEESAISNHNRIYYNFYDSSSADGQYHGVLNMDRGFGTIIAPCATVNLNQNWDGVVVANAVDVRTQFHRIASVINPPTPTTVVETTAKLYFQKQIRNPHVPEGPAADGRLLAGCTLSITLDKPSNKDLSGVTVGNVDAYAATAITLSDDKKTVTWKTNGQNILLEGLPEGEYTWTEIEAEKGYGKSDPIKFKVGADGKVYRFLGNAYSGTPIADGYPIIMNDAPPAKCGFAKKNDWNRNIAGAKFELKITSFAGALNNDGTNDTKFDATKDEYNMKRVFIVSGIADFDSKSADTITWTSTDEVAVFSYLPAGSYELKEISAPDGYVKSDEVIKFTVAKGAELATLNGKEVETISFKNDNETTTMKFSKTSGENGPELAGASLSLHLVSSDFSMKNVEPLEPVPADYKKVGTNTITWTSTGTPLELSNLPEGEYEWTETKAPYGQKVADKIKFKLVYDETSGKMKAYKYVYDDADKKTGDYDTTKALDSIVMVDEPVLADVDFSKVDSKGTPLAGAKLSLHLDSKGVKLTNVTATSNGAALTPAPTLSENDTVITWTSGTKPVVLKNLPSGTYTWVEDDVPNAAYRKADPIKFQIGGDGKIHLWNEAKGAYENTALNTNALTMVDGDADKGKGVFSKKDTWDAELKGATLTITRTSGDLPTGVANLEGAGIKKVSGSDITVTGDVIEWTSGEVPTVIDELPNGYYTWEEKTTPAGYEQATTIKFKVESGKIYLGNEDGTAYSGTAVADSTPIVMTDKNIKKTVTFSKQDSTTSKEIFGATLKLTLTSNDGFDLIHVDKESGPVFTKSSNKKSITWVSEENNPMILNDLPYGTYKWEETIVPAGYDSAKKETVEFKIDATGISKKKADGTYEPVTDGKLVMLNTPKEAAKGKLEITVYDVQTNEIVPEGIAVSVKDADNKEILEPHKVGTNGKIVIPDLPAGKYTVVVDKGSVKETYVYDHMDNGTPTVQENKIAYVDIYLDKAPDPVGSLRVTVYDDKSTTNPKEVVPQGVTVVIRQGDTVVDRKKADDNGVALFEDLAPGTYTVGYEDVKETWKYVRTVGTSSTVVANKTTDAQIYLEKGEADPTKPGALEVIVYLSGDEEKHTPVPGGATVTVKSKTDNKTVFEGELTNGSVLKTALTPGDYTVTVNTKEDGKLAVKEDYQLVNPETKTTQTGTVVAEKTTTIYIPIKPDKGSLKVTVVEVDDDGNVLRVVPEGVHVTVTGGEDTKNDNLTTGTQTFTNLPEGDYTVTASSPKQNYTLVDPTTADPTKTATVTAGQEAEVVIKIKRNPTTAEFSKQDTAGAEIDGAELKLVYTSSTGDLSKVTQVSGPTSFEKADDNKSIKWTSDRTNSMILTNLPVGTYEWQETREPAAYKPAETVKFKIEENGTISKYVNDAGKPVLTNGHWVALEADEKLVMVDADAETGTATFSKVDNTRVEIDGAQLSLVCRSEDVSLSGVTRESGPDDFVYVAEENTITWTSEKDNPMVLSKIPAGEYKWVEIQEPKGYDKAEEVYFKVDKDGNVYKYVDADDKPVTSNGTYVKLGANENLVMVDDKHIPGTATFSKVDSVETTTELEGAHLALKCLTADVDISGVLPVDGAAAHPTFKYDADKKTISWISEANKSMTLKDLPAGEYQWEETQAPDGYDLATETVKFKVSTKGVISKWDGGKYVELQNGEKLVMLNNKTPIPKGNLIITVYEEGTTKVVPKGATVTVVKPDTKTKDKVVAGNDGKITYTNDDIGTYTLFVDDVAPKYEFVSISDKTPIVKKDETTEVIIYIKPSKATEPEVGGLLVTVIDEKTDKVVPNATIEVTDSEGHTDSYVTNDDGQVLITELPEGTCTIVTTKVPDGYTVTKGEKTTTTIEAGKIQEEEVRITIEKQPENPPKGGLVITVYDEKTGEVVPGATVEITQPDGTTKIVTTDEKGQVTLVGVTPGDYVVETTKVPDGYTITEGKKTTATVKPNETTDHKVYIKTDKTPTDVLKGSYTIIVYDEKTGEVVPDAVVKVTSPDNVSKDYVTNKDGKISLTDLTPGTYKAETIKVPDGYTVSIGKVHTSEVKAGEETVCKVYIVTNTASTNTNTNTSGVKTGDSFPLIPVILVMCAALAGIVFFIKRRRED